MALRKFKSPMKIVSILIIIVMCLSVGYTGYNFLINYFEGKERIFTINGIKEEEIKFDLATKINKQSMEQNLEKYLTSNNAEQKVNITDDLAKQYTMLETINQLNLEHLMKVYNVKPDTNQLNEIYNKYVEQAGGESKLALILQQNGLTLKDFKKDIGIQISQETLANKIAESFNVTDKELEVVYEAYKSTEFEGKTFEEAKNDVKTKYLLPQIVLQQMQKNITNAETVTFKGEETKELFNKLQEVVIEKYNVTLADLLPYVVQQMISNVPYEEALNKVKADYETQLDFLNKYKVEMQEKGYSVTEEITNPNDLTEYFILSQASFIKDYKVSDAELKEAFNNYKSSLDKPETFSGLVLEHKFSPSANDDKKALEEANNILKELTHENFAELADKYSSDKASSGGALGKSDINRYVEEFRDALKEHEAGEIFGPIKTMYGYHLIEILEIDENDPNLVDARHILVPINISEETKESQTKEFTKLKSKLESDKINKDNYTKYSNDYTQASPFENLPKDSYIPGIGAVNAVNEEIVKMTVGSVSEVTTDDAVYLVKKQSQEPAKEATFEEYKDRIRLQLAEVAFRTK